MFVFICTTHQLGGVASSAPIDGCCGGGVAGDPVLRVGEAELHWERERRYDVQGSPPHLQKLCPN